TVRRSLRRQLNDLDEVSEKLMPGGVLQERVYHPWVFQGQPPTFPTLSYTTQLTVIKTPERRCRETVRSTREGLSFYCLKIKWNKRHRNGGMKWGDVVKYL